MRWMNRLATALLVTAVVAGPPLLAGAWVLHHRWSSPTSAQIAAWAEQPLTAGTIIGGCLAVTGLAWLLLVVHLTRRGLAELRRRLRRRHHLPVPTPAQMTASSMAGVAAFALPAAPAGHPTPSPSVAGTPQPSDLARADHHADRLAEEEPGGISLPGGGWIPNRTAAAITAVAASVWLHRRRSYRPDPRQPRDHHHDADLQPLPDTVDTITTAISDDAATRSDHPPALLAQPLPEGTLLLTGSGAVAAARGLLVTAALTGISAVAVRPEDLDTLLPAASRTAIWSFSDLVSEADERLISGTLIVLGEGSIISHQWHVKADGMATGTGLDQPRRLCTLTLQTAADLLTLASQQAAPTSTTDLLPKTSRRPITATRASATAAAARLTLLGGCHLAIAGTPVHLRRTAGLQVLAYLALHHQGATRTELTHAIWPHLPAATITQRLYTTLADLRRQLHPLLDENPVTRHDEHYRLNTDVITTDFQQWHTAVRVMIHAVGTSDRLRACQDVVEAYHGDIAAGHNWAWIIPVREQHRRTLIDACAVLAEQAGPEQSLYWLRHAIAIDPYNEPLHHQAADLLAKTGDSTGAADLIKRLHRRLTDDLASPPQR